MGFLQFICKINFPLSPQKEMSSSSEYLLPRKMENFETLCATDLFVLGEYLHFKHSLELYWFIHSSSLGNCKDTSLKKQW